MNIRAHMPICMYMYITCEDTRTRTRAYLFNYIDISSVSKYKGRAHGQLKHILCLHDTMCCKVQCCHRIKVIPPTLRMAMLALSHHKSCSVYKCKHTMCC